MRSAIKALLALAGIAAIVGFIAAPYLLGESDSGRKLYVKSNDAILDRLPLPAGTTEVDHRTAPYYAAKGNAPIAGYRTTVVYRVAGRTAAGVMSFYRSRLERWRGDPGCRIVCRFVRGNAAVVVDTRNVDGGGTYAVVADYAGGQS
jgi:hypothetical protein